MSAGGLLPRLLALHQEAVLTDQSHAAEAPRDARNALTLRALQATCRQAVRVPVRTLPHGSSQHLGVACSVHDAHGSLVVDLVALERVCILQLPVTVDEPHVLWLDAARLLGEFL